MDEFIYLNGEIVRGDRAAISPFDRGLLYGDGLFETMRVYAGRVHLMRRHLERLRDSAAFLGIPIPPAERLADAIERTITANAVHDAALRLTVTRGVGGSAFDIDVEREPTVLIAVRGLPGGTRGAPERIITLRAVHRFPALGRRTKSLDYTIAAHSAREMKAAGVREGLLLTDDGTVASGSVSNIFMIAGRDLITPPLSLGILPGITRGRVMELAPSLSLSVREEAFDRAALLHADACFYTNSLRELVPIESIDGERIAPRAIQYLEGLMEIYHGEAPDEWG